jgi:hypothetical protein
MKIYFVTMNDFKATEVREYLKGSSLELQIVPYRIQEILNLDLEVIVKDKVLKAYAWSARLEMCQWKRETLDKESLWDVARSTSPSR